MFIPQGKDADIVSIHPQQGKLLRGPLLKQIPAECLGELLLNPGIVPAASLSLPTIEFMNEIKDEPMFLSV
jgi:hypothetical protein